MARSRSNLSDVGHPDESSDTAFEPNGLEPELPGFNQSQAPMLGGERRQWPSVAAYLLALQHHAHRRGDLDRVWSLRQMRARVLGLSVRNRMESLRTGEPEAPLTDHDALGAIRAERAEIEDALAQCRQFGRRKRAEELSTYLVVIDEVLGYWADRDTS